MTCALNKGSLPLNFQWKKDKNDLLNSENIRIRNIDDVSVLAIDPINAESRGNYTCVVSNSLGKDEHTAALMVKGSDIFLNLIKCT